GFTDQRHGDVMVVRPMRDYTAKEIAFYNRFFSVPTVSVPPLFTKRREKPSIHQLVERFLLGLQEEFPSTISNVYRSESQRCLLCLCGLDTDGGGTPEFYTHSQATTTAPLSVPVPVPVPRAESKAAYIPLLCYSCRLTFKELGPLATLPPYVRAEGQRR
ncbi:Cytoplasmic tRNA 2-thiolation protein 2, partial [Corvus brachyrhynchos]